MVTIDEFAKLEMKAGTVLAAEAVDGSEKLIKMMVDLGEEKPRQVLAGLKLYYKSESLVGRQFIFAANLQPRVMMGFESQGMILCANAKKPICLRPSHKVPNGTLVR